MPSITFNQAKKFLNNITEKDKVAIIHDDDGDGFASAILYYDFCISKNTIPKTFTSSFRRQFNKIPLEEFNKIIITDIAPNGIQKINLPLNKQIISIDHHPKGPIQKEILDYRDESYAPAAKIAYELTNLKPWLALAGTLSDEGQLYPENQNFINKILKSLNTPYKDFCQNVTFVITNFLIYFEDNTQKAFDILKNINSIEQISKLKKYSKPIENEVQKYVDKYEKNKIKINNINFSLINPKYNTKSIIINIISKKYPNEIHLIAKPLDNDTISISSRYQSQKANLPDLLEKATKNLKNATSGGHPRAAAARIQSKDLNRFKQNLKQINS